MHATRNLLGIITFAILQASCGLALASETGRVSVDTAGGQGELGNSYAPMVSATGRFVVFESEAWYLASGDNGQRHVYLRDRDSPVTERISVSSAGVSGNQGSLHGSVSADGRFVVFQSGATNLVAPATAFGRFHVYLRDRQEGTTVLVSATSQGVEGNRSSTSPVITADGRYVAFETTATNLTDPPGNGQVQIVRYDRLTGEMVLVSLDEAGAQAASACRHPSICDDGTLVVFHTFASLESRDQTANQDIYLRDLAVGSTQLVSVGWNGSESGNLHSANPEISRDGTRVAFESTASNLIDDVWNGSSHIYVRDLVTDSTERVSATPDGQQGNGASFKPAINGDGSVVAFESSASNLVADTNGWSDVFVHRQGSPPLVERVSVRDEALLGPGDPPDGNGWSQAAAIDASGLITAYESWSSDLVSDDTNGFGDVFTRVSDSPVVGVGPPAREFTLSAWPNPLRHGAGVDLQFVLPDRAEPVVSLYDVAGRLVRRLGTGRRWAAGPAHLRWDGRDERGQAAAAGIYLVRLEAGTRVAARKLVLLP